MALVLDASTSGQSGGTSLTISHTTGSGSNRLLVVSISCQDSNHANLPVTSITYNGVSLTKIRHDEPANNVRSEIWYLLNPSSGINNLVINTTGSVWKGAVVSTWTGAKQSSQPDAHNGATGSSSTPSVAVTTVADNCITIDAVSSEAARSSVGAGQTSLGTAQGQSFENVSASYEGPTTPAGSVTMSETLSSSQPWAISAASFSPETAASPSVSTDGVDTVTNVSANANGTVSSDGGSTITERGFVVSTSLNPTVSDTKFTVAGTTGSMSSTLSNLSANTTYHVRAFATNAIGTSYGNDVSFITLSTAARVVKHYFYRVYDAGAYKATWTQEVISEPRFRTTINGGVGEMVIQLARKFDNFGEDVDVKLNNKVDCYLVDKEAPNGVLLYSGYISGYSPQVNMVSEFVNVTVLGYIAEFQRMILKDSSGNTKLTYNSQDPSAILKDVIDKYRLLGGTINYNASSIDNTNTTVSYTFNTNSIKECLDKIIELCPVGWYFRVDPDNIIYLKPKGALANHVFTLGLEIEKLETFRRVEDLVNRVYFTGAGDPALFRVYQNTGSQATYGLYDKKIVDQRVSVAATASIISNREIDSKNAPEIRSRFTIIDNNGPSSRGYNIESIKVGQTLKVANLKAEIKTISLWDQALWDVDVWDQTLATSAADVIQIFSLDYNPDSVVIEASSRLPQIAKRIEDINRNLEDSQMVANPAAPS